MKRKALIEIQKWIWKNEITINEDAWYVIRYNPHSWYNIVYIEYWQWYSYCDILFRFREDAEKCLEEYEKEWNILFN